MTGNGNGHGVPTISPPQQVQVNGDLFVQGVMNQRNAALNEAAGLFAQLMQAKTDLEAAKNELLAAAARTQSLEKQILSLQQHQTRTEQSLVDREAQLKLKSEANHAK